MIPSRRALASLLVSAVGLLAASGAGFSEPEVPSTTTSASESSLLTVTNNLQSDGAGGCTGSYSVQYTPLSVDVSGTIFHNVTLSTCVAWAEYVKDVVPFTYYRNLDGSGTHHVMHKVHMDNSYPMERPYVRQKSDYTSTQARLADTGHYNGHHGSPSSTRSSLYGTWLSSTFHEAIWGSVHDITAEVYGGGTYGCATYHPEYGACYLLQSDTGQAGTQGSQGTGKGTAVQPGQTQAVVMETR